MKLITLLILLITSLLACNRDENRYETCPSFDDADDRLAIEDEVTLHPDLVEDTIEAIERELKYPHTIERLEIEEAGVAIQVTVTDTGTGDRLHGPRHKLGNGSELYHHIHLWGNATFEDGSEVSFRVSAHPVPSGYQCAIQGVAIQPSWFAPI